MHGIIELFGRTFLYITVYDITDGKTDEYRGRKEHHNPLLHGTDFIAERTRHFKRADDGKQHDQRVEKRHVYKYFQEKKSDQDEHVQRRRNGTYFHIITSLSGVSLP